MTDIVRPAGEPEIAGRLVHNADLATFILARQRLASRLFTRGGDFNNYGTIEVIMRTFVCSASLALLSFTASAGAQLVVGNSQPVTTDPTLWLIDLSGANAPRALASGSVVVGTVLVNAGTAWGAAADESARVLYWNNESALFSAPYSTSGPLTPTGVRLKLAGTIPPAVISVTSLAFDTMDHKLYGFKSTANVVNGVTYPVGFYEIEPATGLATLVLALPGSDFGGFDYDPGTNAFYGLNDSVSGFGRGLFKFSNPLAGVGIAQLAHYPGNEEDIDGMAAGGGRIYLVNDTPSDGIQVYNLATNEYEAPIASPFTAGGSFAAGAWAPGLMTFTPLCGTSDFDGDGDFGTDADIEAFFACLGGNCCPHCFAGGADFDMDGDTGTDSDIETFFRVLAGGSC